MVITNRKINKNDTELQIVGQKIERLSRKKYLSVILDDNLKMGDHVDYVYKKMGQKYIFMYSIG
jgi:hypothetical protein